VIKSTAIEHSKL